jgi:hypothetical protein
MVLASEGLYHGQRDRKMFLKKIGTMASKCQITHPERSQSSLFTPHDFAIPIWYFEVLPGFNPYHLAGHRARSFKELLWKEAKISTCGARELIRYLKHKDLPQKVEMIEMYSVKMGFMSLRLYESRRCAEVERWCPFNEKLKNWENVENDEEKRKERKLWGN